MALIMEETIQHKHTKFLQNGYTHPHTMAAPMAIPANTFTANAPRSQIK